MSDWLIASISNLGFFADSIYPAFGVIPQIFFNEFAVVPASISKSLSPIVVGGRVNPRFEFPYPLHRLSLAFGCVRRTGLLSVSILVFTLHLPAQHTSYA